MGCKNSKQKEKHLKQVKKSIQSVIEDDDCSALQKTLDRNSGIIGDLNGEEITIIDSKFISPLTYTVLKGSNQCYKILVSHYNCSFDKMESQLGSLNLDLLIYICENGYIDLLKTILTDKYLDQISENGFSNKYSSLSPIHSAVKSGHLSIVSYLTGNPALSKLTFFNIHYIDPVTGENCAFMSVRSCSFTMIKLLFESYKVDFSLLNLKNQTVFQVLAEISLENFSFSQLECLMYLAEVIKLDVEINYQEVLNTLENRSMLKYYKQKLKQKGINAKKEILLKSGIESSKDPIDTIQLSNVSQILTNSSKSEFTVSSFNLQSSI